jgi:hypothetical protein
MGSFGRFGSSGPCWTGRQELLRHWDKITTVSNDEVIHGYNRRAWERQVKRGSQWTVPVTADEVARARNGDWRIN